MEITKEVKEDINYLYVLLLENDNYYVGIANDIGLRLWTHFNGLGSAWTKKYQPIQVIHCSQLQISSLKKREYIERTVTLRLAKLKGFEKVRGGPFCLSKKAPDTWSNYLKGIKTADLNKMCPLSDNDFNQLIQGKEKEYKKKKLEAIKNSGRKR